MSECAVFPSESERVGLHYYGRGEGERRRGLFTNSEVSGLLLEVLVFTGIT